MKLHGKPEGYGGTYQECERAWFQCGTHTLFLDQYIEDGGTYKVKDEWLNRVYEVVGYCVSNDMYAIVNIHWDGGWLENNCTADKQEANNKKQKALWTQIANKLNVYDEHLLFAGCNRQCGKYCPNGCIEIL